MSTLQQLREEAGFLTPEAFAAHADLSNNTIRRAERGRVITRQSALRIARVLQMPLEEIEGLQYVGKDGSDNGAAPERSLGTP